MKRLGRWLFILNQISWEGVSHPCPEMVNIRIMWPLKNGENSTLWQCSRIKRQYIIRWRHNLVIKLYWGKVHFMTMVRNVSLWSTEKTPKIGWCMMVKICDFPQVDLGLPLKTRTSPGFWPRFHRCEVGKGLWARHIAADHLAFFFYGTE